MPCGGWVKTGDFALEKRQHEGWYGVGVLCVCVAPWNEGQVSVQYNDGVSRWNALAPFTGDEEGAREVGYHRNEDPLLLLNSVILLHAVVLFLRFQNVLMQLYHDVGIDFFMSYACFHQDEFIILLLLLLLLWGTVNWVCEEIGWWI